VDSFGSEYISVVGSREYGKELSGSIKCMKLYY